MVFIGGTQSSKWMFTQEQLLEKRSKANRKCKNSLREYDTNKDMSLCITDAEEGKVVDAFLNMIRHFYRKFSPPLPMQVYGVSATYFRRFFLKYSVMDFHPREIIVACIYVACKVTEFSISMETFLKNIPKNSEKYHSFIYDSELFLIDELNYDLWIYTPYESFKAYLVDFKAFNIELLLVTKDPLDRLEERNKLLAENDLTIKDHIKIGINVINDWYESDLMILFSPDHIALAAVEVSVSTNPTIFNQYLRKKICDNNELVFTNLIEVLVNIKEYIRHSLIIHSVENLKAYEHRIDMFRNPKYNVQSEVYKEFKEKYDKKYNSFD